MSDLATALLAAQKELPKLQKTKLNPAFRSKYVPLEEVHEEVLPILHDHGFVWVTMPMLGGLVANGDRLTEGQPCLHYRLIHAESGEEIEGVMPLMLDKQNPQGQGSAITYARRYALMAVLGLVADSDDDGNAASGQSSRRAAPKRRTTKPAEPKADGPAKADKEQLENIVTLAKQCGMTNSSDEFKAILAEHGDGKGVRELDSDQATQVIMALAAKAREAGEK